MESLITFFPSTANSSTPSFRRDEEIRFVGLMGVRKFVCGWFLEINAHYLLEKRVSLFGMFKILNRNAARQICGWMTSIARCYQSHQNTSIEVVGRLFSLSKVFGFEPYEREKIQLGGIFKLNRICWFDRAPEVMQSPCKKKGFYRSRTGRRNGE